MGRGKAMVAGLVQIGVTASGGLRPRQDTRAAPDLRKRGTELLRLRLANSRSQGCRVSWGADRSSHLVGRPPQSLTQWVGSLLSCHRTSPRFEPGRVAVSGILLVALVAAQAKVAPPAFPDLGDKDAILCESGKTVVGKIEKRTSTLVHIHDGTKSRIFRRSLVVGISFGDVKAREEIRKAWQRTGGSASAWYQLGLECVKKRLGVEAALCLMHVLELDPKHREAHVALGHAELDGAWLDRAEVRRKLAEGYVNENGKLVKKGEGDSSGKTEVKEEKRKKWPEHKRRLLEDQKWSSADLARFERERKQRAKDGEEFKAQMEKEYLGVPWAKHFEVKTSNYVLQCNSTKAVAQRYAKLMEQLYDMLERRFPPDRKGLRGKSVVRIYRNGDDFREQTGMFYGVGGFYSPVSGELCAYHGTFGTTATTFNVLAHEGTHQFQGKVLRDFRNIPMWLIEGLAVYFGDGARIDPSGKLVTERIPRDRLLHIQEKIQLDKHERLGKLVTLDRRGFSGSHYSDSWALIHFLVNSGPKGQKLLSAYWNRGQKAKIEYGDFEALAKEHSGSVEALEEKYLEHVMALRPDPAGEVRGDHYFSKEFAFELRRLGPEWRFYEEYKRGFLVGQMLPGTSAEVEVIFRNNDERAQSGQDYVKDYVLNYKNKYLPIRYSSIKAKPVKMHGTQAFLFTYEDGGSGGSISGIGIDDLVEEIRRRREGVPDPADPAKPAKLRTYYEYLIVDFDGTFSIRASAEKEEFDNFSGAFGLLADYFEPIRERRW